MPKDDKTVFVETIKLCHECVGKCDSKEHTPKVRSTNPLFIKGLCPPLHNFKPVPKTVSQVKGRCYNCDTVSKPMTQAARNCPDDFLVTMTDWPVFEQRTKSVFLCKDRAQAEIVLQNATFRGDQRYVSVGERSNLYKKESGMQYTFRGSTITIRTIYNSGWWYIENYFERLESGNIQGINKDIK